MTTEEVALALLLLDEEENEEEPERRSTCWVRPWLVNKNTGCFYTVFQELKTDDAAFKDFIRMDKTQYEYLVQRIYDEILKKDTNMRECIKPHEMVCLTLRYLASEKTFRSLEFQFRIGRRTISDIIIAVCDAIIKILGPDYLNTPKNTEQWLNIADRFYQRWNFPNGIGAIDGKHIVVQQPSDSCSHYRNYKGTGSIV